MEKVRIGSGAGYAGDRIEPALDLIKYGNLDYIIFECLAERTIAIAQCEKSRDSQKGYNSLLEYRMNKVIPLLKDNSVKVITNMGAANPLEAAKITKKICEKNHLSHLKIACVYGDDVLDSIELFKDYKTLETGMCITEFFDDIVSANSYIGAETIVDALKNDADIIITGRVSDPSLTVGPLVFEFEKQFNDTNFIAQASIAGHILECGAQVTGGYYACPPLKKVPKLWEIGFPIVEFYESGNFTVEKLPGTGGLISNETVKEQLIYEIHDPENYLTPDVIVDLSKVFVEEKKGIVSVKNIKGKQPTGFFKTSIGYNAGFIVEGEISYGGEKAYELASIACDVLIHRIEDVGIKYEEKRIDYIGLNSLYGEDLNEKSHIPKEIRLRMAIRTLNRDSAKDFCREFESLYTNGPAAGGGIRTGINEIVGIESILIDASKVITGFELI